MRICKKCFISGKVQGVFFRVSTQEQAIANEITGYAKNLANGAVEVLLCGEQKQVEILIEWLHHGPDYAQVVTVDCQDQPYSSLNIPKKFDIAY